MRRSDRYEEIGHDGRRRGRDTILLAGALVRPSLRRRVLRRAAADALAEERRRLAADVHDLVMQEIAIAVAAARALLDDPAPTPEVGSVLAAGERALAGARAIVSGLGKRCHEPAATVVEKSVRGAARHARLSFDAGGVAADEHADAATCDALTHIGREAVTNAVKHGAPTAIAVVLDHEDEWRLTVQDDGRGFDAASVRRGFGLGSMRASATALGGSLRLHSAPGAGTMVEAVLP
jgi:signal transduction histidine kinase